MKMSPIISKSEERTDMEIGYRGKNVRNAALLKIPSITQGQKTVLGQDGRSAVGVGIVGIP